MNLYRFGRRSLRQRDSCSEHLRRVLDRAIAISPDDFTVVCGHRGQEAQAEAYATGTSTKDWPNSRHNSYPAEAFDVAPWRIQASGRGYIPWKDTGAFYKLAGVIEAAAILEGVNLRHGGDWDDDGLTRDQNFHDLGHFEEIL